MNVKNITIYLHVAVWGLKTSFESIGLKIFTCQAVSPEPELRFSKTRPHFIQNHNLNPMNIHTIIYFSHQGLGPEN